MAPPWSRAWKNESEILSVRSDSLPPHGLCSLWNSPGQNIGVRRLFLLQGIFPTQGLNPGQRQGPHRTTRLRQIHCIAATHGVPTCNLHTFIHLFLTEAPQVSKQSPFLQVNKAKLRGSVYGANHMLILRDGIWFGRWISNSGQSDSISTWALFFQSLKWEL